MNESLVDVTARGALMGAVLVLLVLAVNLARRLIRSKTEGARRLKLVIGVAIVFIVGSAMVSGMGPLGALGTCVVIAALVWVFKGFKTNESGIPMPDVAAPPRRDSAEEDATEFTEVKDTAPQRKTVITCPKCDGRLRVLAGKYIDVTCPHCKTVFRTHT